MMDDRFLRHYEQELNFLREAGDEFAQEYPSVAGALGLRLDDVTDPSVERLLEGLSFLTARVQLQMDAEFSTFTHNLLALVQPQCLLPVPSMAVVQFAPDLQEGSLTSGFTLPCNTALRTMSNNQDQQPRCEFRSLSPVTLWPIRLESVEYLPCTKLLTGLPVALVDQAVSALRLSVRTTPGLRFEQLALEELTLFLSGDDSLPMILQEALLAHSIGMLVRPAECDAPWGCLIGPEQITQAFQELSLGPSANSSSGDLAFAQLRRFLAFAPGQRFITLGGLAPAVRQCSSDHLELLILFKPLSLQLPTRLDVSSLALFCAPAINLFRKHTDRIVYDPYRQELPVVVDKSRRLAHEVLEVLSVYGYAAGAKERQVFLPLYSPHGLAGNDIPPAGFYQLHRTPSRRAGKVVTRSSFYQGSDVNLSLLISPSIIGAAGPAQLAVEVLCSNRDLPLSIPLGKGNTDFALDISAPVLSVRCVVGPSKPVQAPLQGERQWQAVRQLSRNFLPLTDGDGRTGARALRDLLSLYVADDSVSGKLLQAVHSLRAELITRRLPGPGPVTFGRGLKLILTLNDAACEGTGTYAFGSVLEAFFAHYSALNSFTETELHSATRGHIKTWRARATQCMTL
jgi:type VI secretion system protein ImpG